MKQDVSRKLLETHHVREEDLRRAYEIEKSEGGSVTTALVKLGVVTEDQLLQFLEDSYGTKASTSTRSMSIRPWSG